MVKHMPSHVTIMALTAYPDVETCPLLQSSFPDYSCNNDDHHKDHKDDNSKCLTTNKILLPAPIHESEVSTFGVAAPTTSTTVALAVGDMLALTVADVLYQGKSGAVFLRNHPGGSIGAGAKAVK